MYEVASDLRQVPATFENPALVGIIPLRCVYCK